MMSVGVCVGVCVPVCLCARVCERERAMVERGTDNNIT